MILIINTSLPGIELLVGNDSTSSKYKKIETDKQSVALPEAMENFLNENDLKWSDLTAIGVVVGPGSFTGIRLGIAYAKGISVGLDIPVVGINAFEIYLEKNPNAFVAIDSGRGDFFCASQMIDPCVMTIDEVEPKQMDYPQTVGHLPFDLRDGFNVTWRKLKRQPEPVIPLYLRPSYAETSCKSS